MPTYPEFCLPDGYNTLAIREGSEGLHVIAIRCRKGDVNYLSGDTHH